MGLVSSEEALQRLHTSSWTRDADTLEIFKVLDGSSERTRAVGGVVRDTIVGKYGIRTDLDLATELEPNEVLQRAKEAGMSGYPTGIDHGTVTIRHGQATAEVTTLREDVDSDGRHALVKFGSDWAGDANRRDFTINALYCSFKGALFDPLNGLEDLLAGRVVFIGDADQRIAEDYLRVYRFFRFTAGYAGELCDPEGLAACARAVDKLGQISAERVGAEMMKLLSQHRVAATMAAMTKSGVYELSVPTLEALVAYEDVSFSPVAIARLSIMLFERDPEELKAEWRLSNALMNEAKELCVAADICLAGSLYNVAYRHGRLGTVALTVAAAMARWPLSHYREMLDKFRSIQVEQFPITGDDVVSLGLEPGPELGQALRQIESDWIESGFTLDRQAMLDWIKIYHTGPL